MSDPIKKDARVSGGVPNHGIARDFPLLWERSKLHDERERLGGDRDPIGAEIDAALRELWSARAYVSQGEEMRRANH